MAGIPGALNSAGTGQDDNFYAYEETPVEYMFVTEKYFPASRRERFVNEMLSCADNKLIFFREVQSQALFATMLLTLS